MPKYTVDYLYNEFKGLASMRNNPQYANDDGYWVGGHCNWGGRHQLREDCQTLARGFEKMESLDGEKIKAELNKCTSQNEYESKKADYVRKANEISSGLQARTGYSSSMFGICIIWSDYAMSPFVENKMQDCRRQLENLRSQIGGEKYQHVEKLRLLKLEEKKIRDKISELRRDAGKEKDPTKKARMLLLIEEEGKKLEDNLREQKTIPKSGINFDPKQHVDGLIDGIRRALAGKGGSGGGGGSGRPNKPRKPGEPNDPFGGGGGGGGSLPDGNNDPNKPPRQRRDKPEKDNQQLILIALAIAFVLFFLMNQKEKPQRDDDWEYYD